LSIEVDPDQDEYMYEEDSTTSIPEFVPPPINDNDDAPINIVEIMPRFPGCEDMNTNMEREKCAQEKMLQYIYSNLEYPVIARETGIEGRVVIRFVVSKTGEINSVKILRDIGGGCGEAAAEVINNMNNLPEKWIPGRQGGRKVSVFYTLPVVFKLR
ncbi:MAG TPA: energy transducer TonB, partial [Bacteroidetes bacterium]|nr:energy transducer TonB [Bacteroidota bacterium]